MEFSSFYYDLFFSNSMPLVLEYEVKRKIIRIE